MSVWAFHVLPVEDEALSSYLRRVALMHGMTPYAFISLYLNSKEFWARDVDRGPIQAFEEKLGELSRLGVSKIRSMTFRSWAAVLTPRNYETGKPPAILPWINASGVFHRIRKRHALQFCPCCIAESPVVKKHWRLSFVLFCQRHGCMLRDSCVHCDAPFIAHRSQYMRLRCHQCNLNLDAIHGIVQAADEDKSAMELQARLTELFSLRNSSHSQLARLELLGLRSLIAAIITGRYWARTAKIIDLEQIALDKKLTGPLRIELLRHEKRLHIMRICARLLEDWPKGFNKVIETNGVRQEDFILPVDEMPKWLADEVINLDRQSYKKPSDRFRRVQDKLENLESSKSGNWRATQANIVFELARSVDGLR